MCRWEEGQFPDNAIDMTGRDFETRLKQTLDKQKNALDDFLRGMHEREVKEVNRDQSWHRYVSTFMRWNKHRERSRQRETESEGGGEWRDIENEVLQDRTEQIWGKK